MSRPHVVNDPRTFVADSLRGYAAATEDVVWVPDPGYLRRRERPADGAVAVVSGGGSGHEPLHAGFVGAGMLAAACPGLVFTSPNAVQIHAVTVDVDAGGGVLHIVKNYTGDVMNFAIAADLATRDGVRVETVIVDDDVATDTPHSSPTPDTTGAGDGAVGGPGRRGTAATVIVEKVCGAAAARGRSLHDVAALGRRVVGDARSMAVALRPPTLPGEDRPSFDLPPGRLELGIGIHGERGRSRTEVLPAGELAAALTEPVLAALDLAPRDRVLVLVNGLGAAHPLELSVLFAEVVDLLQARGLTIERTLVGSFVTALDMAGVSVTLARVDDEILELWDQPTTAPAWPNAPTRHFTGIAPRGTAGVSLRAPEPGSSQDPPLPPAGPHALSHAETVRWLADFTARVLRAEPELAELDRQAGDGDFGATQAAALTGLPDLTRTGHRNLASIFTLLSEAYLARAGGTSGALFGMLFRAFARTAATQAVDGLDLAALTAATRDGYDTIRALDGAEPGDRTMLDAIAPALAALDDALNGGSTLETALTEAAAAAGRGADATATMTARRGRASYVGEAAHGVVDPGALVIAWLFAAARDAITTS